MENKKNSLSIIYLIVLLVSVIIGLSMYVYTQRPDLMRYFTGEVLNISGCQKVSTRTYNRYKGWLNDIDIQIDELQDRYESILLISDDDLKPYTTINDLMNKYGDIFMAKKNELDCNIKDFFEKPLFNLEVLVYESIDNYHDQYENIYTCSFKDEELETELRDKLGVLSKKINNLIGNNLSTNLDI